MIKRSKIVSIGVAVTVLIVIFAIVKAKRAPLSEILREVKPSIESIRTSISTTATVQPQNRLEIKPPINGRIEDILVKEGEKVKAGQILAWMSSTERAALLDAARARGPDVLKYWEDVYKPTPLISPIDGEVIVSTDEPGQTVTSSDVIVVLSDHLIVQAQVDETDIGKVKVAQKAMISLDAYPDIKVDGKVDHIYYESKVVNNVTIYQVDIVPDSVPDVFRSGMSATIVIVQETKDRVMTIPLDAVRQNKQGAYVFVKPHSKAKWVEQKIEIGISDEKNIEVLSGVSVDDAIVISQKRLPAGAPKTGNNPFMPARRSGR